LRATLPNDEDLSGWVREEREHCCDEIVVRQTGQARAYAETLLTLSTPAMEPVPRMAMAIACGHLVARVRRILDFGADRHPMKLPRSLLVLAGVLLIMLVGLVFSRAQQAGPKSMAKDCLHLSRALVGVAEGVVARRQRESQ
jgi:bla regulator protein BlaR1